MLSTEEATLAVGERKGVLERPAEEATLATEEATLAVGERKGVLEHPAEEATLAVGERKGVLEHPAEEATLAVGEREGVLGCTTEEVTDSLSSSDDDEVPDETCLFFPLDDALIVTPVTCNSPFIAASGSY